MYIVRRFIVLKNIAVRNVSTWYDKNGKSHYSDVTKYYPKTSNDLVKAKKYMEIFVMEGVKF